MNPLELFYKLKQRILETYRNSYPYFQGDWRTFSSKDIRQLIDLVEEKLNERVSEKWIYTHLKPESNEKLPRKDMLDIFSRFVGYSDWEEFIFKNREKERSKISSEKRQKNKWIIWIGVGALIFATGWLVYSFYLKKSNPKTIEIKNEFTNDPIQSDEVQVFKIDENKKEPIEITDSKIQLENTDEKIVVESPYFETKEVHINDTDNEIQLKPEDYAMVLKTFINSDLNGWEERKEKLNKILSDDLEVILLSKENLGAEYLNKTEFSEKLIIPTSETKKMKIIHLETSDQKQITFIRIQQL